MSDVSPDLGFARLDFSRPRRTGMAETVYCPGKTAGQLVAILRAFAAAGQSVLGTRCTPEQAEAARAAGLDVAYEAVASGHSQEGLTVTAPAGGYVKNVAVKEGDYVNMGQALATLSGDKKLQLILLILY